jgi:hypothetical protein
VDTPHEHLLGVVEIVEHRDQSFLLLGVERTETAVARAKVVDEARLLPAGRGRGEAFEPRASLREIVGDEPAQRTGGDEEPIDIVTVCIRILRFTDDGLYWSSVNATGRVERYAG